MNLSKILLKGLIILTLAIVPIGTFVVKMDPYQFFKEDDIFLSQERYQIPGLAKNQTYDTAIVGTSMIENFVDSEVSEALNVNAIKLPINASYATEQGLVIDRAMEHNNPKNIIWNIDYRCLDIDLGDFYEKEIEFPEYMYDDKLSNDWRYIINHSSLFLSMKKKIYKDSGRDEFNEFKDDLDKLNTWYGWQEFSRDRLLDDYKELKSGKRDLGDKLNFNDLSQVEDIIDKELISRFERYSDTNFIITFPPKSILWFRLLDEKAILDDKEQAQLYLLKRVRNLSNVSVYNFQNVYEITENFDIYHDLNHYDKSGNDYIIESIKNKTHKTDENQYIDEMKDLREHIYSDKVKDFVK